MGKVAVKILIKNKSNNKILITRDSKDEIFEIPGGRLDEKESIEKSIERELYEELGLKLKKVNPKYVYSEYFLHERENQNHLLIVFLIELSKLEISKLKYSTEVVEMNWVDKKSYNKYEYFSNIKNTLGFYFKAKK